MQKSWTIIYIYSERLIQGLTAPERSFACVPFCRTRRWGACAMGSPIRAMSWSSSQKGSLTASSAEWRCGGHWRRPVPVGTIKFPVCRPRRRQNWDMKRSLETSLTCILRQTVQRFQGFSFWDSVKWNEVIWFKWIDRLVLARSETILNGGVACF